MLKAVVSMQRSDGTYGNVGGIDRWVTGEYKTRAGLLRYALPDRGTFRVEIFRADRFYDAPLETVEVVK